MTDSRRWLEASVRDLLKDRGYKKQRLNWRRLNLETVLVPNLQKSAWGDAYYLNAGIYLRALGPATSPACYHCHVYGRLDPIVPDPRRLDALLDFSPDEIPRDTRRSELRRLLSDFVLPWFDHRSTLVQLARELPGNHPGLLVSRTAAVYLSRFRDDSSA